MNVYENVVKLVEYGIAEGLTDSADRIYTVNRLYEILKLDGDGEAVSFPKLTEGGLSEILSELTDYAVEHGLTGGDSITYRDLFDTKIMGALTPNPSVVINKFNDIKRTDPKAATDWFYDLSCKTNYIRTDRVKKDLKWKYACDFGDIDITINLSKPEKDPKAIAAAKNSAQKGYPACQLCVENEGYAGRADHPARQNLRIVPVVMNNETWGFQYSPYVYYNEHCIILNSKHTPMKIDRSTFVKLLDFVEQFPHYMLGSNADLPIVGGSILTHDHFQGGRYEFAMALAETEMELHFAGFENVKAGIIKWPMSVIRLESADRTALTELAEKILLAWRGYTDREAFVFAETDGEPHNTITPIARMKNGKYQMDLVLRNNITTAEHPLGVFHPHAGLHHIKKENIGLIEVMGCAILPARLKNELARIGEALVSGTDISEDPVLCIHDVWVKELRGKYASFDTDTVFEVLKKEVGKVFVDVLNDAGVFKYTESGRSAFRRFTDSIK